MIRLLLPIAALTALTLGSSSALAGTESQFIRGDVNIDGDVDIADPVALLQWMFIPGGGSPPECADSADANDDGAIDMADVIYSLSAQFVAGAPPIPAPNTCGIDATPDLLTCDSFDLCPDVMTGVDFNQFVLDRFAETSDFTEPTPVNLLTFIFNDDPAAFDALLMP
ncbi:MAG: dockerin type I domain-containing protein [Planctomycetota bacterium]